MIDSLKTEIQELRANEEELRADNQYFRDQIRNN